MSEEEKYYNKISKNTIMSVEDAKNIINDMRNDKFKIIGKVKYTNLETATIRMLKEAQSLERKLERLKQENEELKQENRRIKFFSNNLFIDDYIPKKVIKDKIEELKISGKTEIRNNKNEVIEEHYFLQDEIDILQEILEGDKNE